MSKEIGKVIISYMKSFIYLIFPSDKDIHTKDVIFIFIAIIMLILFMWITSK
jgi:hypothetical protein